MLRSSCTEGARSWPRIQQSPLRWCTHVGVPRAALSTLDLKTHSS